MTKKITRKFKIGDRVRWEGWNGGPVECTGLVVGHYDLADGRKLAIVTDEMECLELPEHEPLLQSALMEELGALLGRQRYALRHKYGHLLAPIS
jgi:hypothetical protein